MWQSRHICRCMSFLRQISGQCRSPEATAVPSATVDNRHVRGCIGLPPHDDQSLIVSEQPAFLVSPASRASRGEKMVRKRADRERKQREKRVELLTAGRLVLQESAPYGVAITLVIANPAPGGEETGSVGEILANLGG
jgi:hypothetical protein